MSLIGEQRQRFMCGKRSSRLLNGRRFVWDPNGRRHGREGGKPREMDFKGGRDRN